MENTDLISIIIPCYNDWQYVEQAVDSAINQTFLNKEIIVIDDGSNSKTKEVLKQLEPKITKLITQENQGQSKARNVGIEAAKGNYILLLDSDDFFEKSLCEKAIELFKSSQDIKLVTCQANLLFEDGSSRIFTPKGGKIADFIFGNNALGTSMFKKADWNSCGGYDEQMRNGFEDWEFFIRLLKNGGEAKVIHEPLYIYRKRNNSTTTVANSRKYELLTYVFNKNKTLYIDNFEQYTDYLLKLIQREEIDKKKKMNSIDYKIGKTILKPYRVLKSFFKK
ncbi:glycosyltransferase family 2 protein [Flavobacterium sp. 2]|uniref:glycosyltransferase family 2 protein n=1 Tax=Flavobacterium sp. 2 TaxID=308053 RepID=UPI003CEB3F47